LKKLARGRGKKSLHVGTVSLKGGQNGKRNKMSKKGARRSGCLLWTEDSKKKKKGEGDTH